MAHIIEVEDKAMLATQRCDRCGAQAWVEVALSSAAPVEVEHDWVYPQNREAFEAIKQQDSKTLLFCGTHARENWEALNAIPEAMIADHRPTLQKQESGQRDAASAAH